MGIIQYKDKFDIYDPRKGQDKKIDLYNKQTFSSLNNGFLVIEAYRKIKLFRKIAKFKFVDIDHMIKISMLNQGGIGFFSFSPLTEQAKKSKVIEMNNVEYMKDAILGYFDINASSLEQIIKKHRKILSYEEWVIGSCINKFKKSGPSQDESIEAYWNIDFFLSQADNINCLFYYNSDVGFLIFITRIFDGLDKELSKFLE